MFEKTRYRRRPDTASDAVSDTLAGPEPRPLSLFGLNEQVGPLVDRLVDRTAERVIPGLQRTFVVAVIAAASLAAVLAGIATAAALLVIGVAKT